MKIKKMFNILFFVLGTLWLFLMLSFPSEFTQIKYFLLILLILASIFEILIFKKNQNRNLILGIILWIATYLIFLILGLINNYSIDFSLISVYFITPIIALILSQIIDSKSRLENLFNILFGITIFIVLLDFLYILDIRNILKLGINFNSEIYGSVSVSEEKVEFRITNQTSLMFLLPFVITNFINKNYNTFFKKNLYIIALILGAVVTILSGRRAFQIVVVLSVILNYMFIMLVFKKSTNNVDYRKTLTFIIKMLSLLFISAITLKFMTNLLEIENFKESIFNTITSAFDSSTGSGEIRKIQMLALLDGWKNSPFLGHGLSSYLRDYMRSEKTPWSYEWVYIALVYQTGLLGISLFVFVVYRLNKKLFIYTDKLQNKQGKIFFSIMIGFICFLIAGSSNPMVYYVWMWSFVLIPFNYKKINE